MFAGIGIERAGLEKHSVRPHQLGGLDVVSPPRLEVCPVPQREVKAGLDRDVPLEVLEPVPAGEPVLVGEPVTWCHRMVTCAKKDG